MKKKTRKKNEIACKLSGWAMELANFLRYKEGWTPTRAANQAWLCLPCKLPEVQGGLDANAGGKSGLALPACVGGAGQGRGDAGLQQGGRLASHCSRHGVQGY